MNTSKKSKFTQDIQNIQQERYVNSKTINKYKIALKQCQIILKAMKLELSSLENQIKQKNTIIDKLISQKQDHILHLYSCQNDTARKSLQMCERKNQEMKQKINIMVLKYQQIMKKNQEEVQRLKGFNKVLRIQNNHLREDNLSLKNTNNYHKNKKIGAISQSLSKSKQLNPPLYTYTVNSRDLTQFNPSKVYYHDISSIITPEKISMNRQNSKNVSTEARSSNRYARNQQQYKKYQHPSTVLFQKQSYVSESSQKRQQYINLSKCQDKLKGCNIQKIEGWFKKLKSLLDDSDDD